MASCSDVSSLSKEELICPLCRKIYKDPVLLSCGHNFCQVCIEEVWERQAARGVCSCPDCYTELREILPLQRNLQLCNRLDQLRSVQVTPKEATVYCTFCVETPLPAIKTCLHCETSLCETHLRKHNETVDHTLTEPTNFLSSRKCLEHKEPIKYYCNDDGTCVCVTCCVAGKHKNHNVETVTEAAEKKKQELARFHQKLCLQNKDIERAIQELQEHLVTTEEAASREKKKIGALYLEIRELLEIAERKTLDGVESEAKRVLDNLLGQIRVLELKKTSNLQKLQKIRNLRDISDPIPFLNRLNCASTDAEKNRAVVITNASLDMKAVSLLMHSGLDTLL
uniref:Uncharacterized protein n=1 Tax=Latimeria chalumnae TaxID=7897 RepID=H3B8D8_LATCH